MPFNGKINQEFESSPFTQSPNLINVQGLISSHRVEKCIQNNKRKCTGGSRLMRISLVRISLLRFFKTFQKYLPYANFGLFFSLLRIFG